MYMSSSPHEKVGDDVSEYHDEGLLTIGTPDPMPGGFCTWDDYDGRGLNQSRARSSAAANWSLFFAVGGSKTDGDPRTERKNNHEVQRTQESPKGFLILKICVPFTRVGQPPIIGRRMDFYIPIIPTDLENILLELCKKCPK
jgi:hypothetical protein